jgi:hypothetical protein
VSSARLLKDNGINTSADPLSQLLVMLHRTNNIQASPNVISDRTAIDSWAYNQYQLDHIWHKDDVPYGYKETTDRFVELAMRELDLVVYFPVFWLPQYDGVRSPVHDYQYKVDSYIKQGLSKFWYGPFLAMDNESPKDRVEKVVDKINKIKH